MFREYRGSKTTPFRHLVVHVLIICVVLLNVHGVVVPPNHRCMGDSDGSVAARGGDLRDHFVHQVQKYAYRITYQESRVRWGRWLGPSLFRPVYPHFVVIKVARTQRSCSKPGCICSTSATLNESTRAHVRPVSCFFTLPLPFSSVTTSPATPTIGPICPRWRERGQGAGIQPPEVSATGGVAWECRKPF